jgi:class 3 adenylate cyclase/CHASE2 domain-containing sensor protein
MRIRDAAVAAAVAFLAAVLVLSPPAERLSGLSIDSLFWLRHQLFGGAVPSRPSEAVVIAIDEETYRRTPFRDIPRVMWTPQVADVLGATLDAGAKVVGFDVIFPTSVESYIAGFDRAFRLALLRGARAGKVVLGKVQHQEQPIAPHSGQSFAVGHEKNIRVVNVFEDGDGIIRRLPLRFTETGRGDPRDDPSMALELAIRASGAMPETSADGTISLDGRPIPGSRRGAMLLNFEGAPGAIPIHSFADLNACLGTGQAPDFFRRNFAGKVVLFGTVLDVEDRKLTSMRFITGPEDERPAERCTLPVMTELFKPGLVRDSIAGVFLHATGVNNLLRGDALRELAGPGNAFAVFGVALAAAAATLLLAPSAAAALVAVGLSAWAGAAAAAFDANLVLPLYPPMAAAVLAFVVLAGYRIAVTDKDKRYIRKVFSLYLAPSVIDEMIKSERLPTLGGETREVTILFSDIASFTSISEGLAPPQVVTFLNEYLTAMTEVIEERGGYIEKYVADAITGVFGAPLDDPDHARHAVDAALAAERRLAEMQERFELPGGRRLAQRIGVNSGEMLVGNIGSRQRFNYQAMGDAANLGARLEGANKFYGTGILVGERTRELCGDALLFRAVDRIRVVGRETPIAIYQPLCASDEADAAMRAFAEAFARALALYEARDFDAAAASFDALAGADPVSKMFAARVRAYIAAPPPADWDGVTNLESK